MQIQWPCFNCGFACPSTGRIENAAGPIVCDACRSKGVVAGDNPPNQVTIVEKSSQSENSSLKISPSGSASGNTPFANREADMILGNLPLEINLGTPIALQGQETKLVGGADCNLIGLQDHFHPGAGLKISDDNLMKPQEDHKQTFSEAENPFLWNPSNVHRKSRSKLPQYTPSPIERFVRQLYLAAQNPEPNNVSGSRDNSPINDTPKYDDFLIYEKPNFIPDNEIGLGCMLLAPPVSCTKDKTATSGKSSNPGCSTAPLNDLMPSELPIDEEDGASPLSDVPVRGPSEKRVRGEASSLHENSRLRRLNDIYHYDSSPEIKTTDKDLLITKETLELEEESLVDVPSTCSFDENINLASFEELNVEILFSDMGEKMTLMDLNDYH